MERREAIEAIMAEYATDPDMSMTCAAERAYAAGVEAAATASSNDERTLFIRDVVKMAFATSYSNTASVGQLSLEHIWLDAEELWQKKPEHL